MGVIKVEYKILADAVKSGKYTSYTAVGRDYGVSDKTVRQAARQYGIELPERYGNPEKDFADGEQWEKGFDREWREAVERIVG